MEKDLRDILFKDLCARLPYGIICDDGYGNILELNGIDKPNTATFKCSDKTFWTTDLDKCKPYLFPLSSMTKEQEDEWDDLYIKPLCERLNPHTRKEDLMLRAKAGYAATFWLMENHFDYLGLIPMGLALDATNLNIY